MKNLFLFLTALLFIVFASACNNDNQGASTLVGGERTEVISCLDPVAQGRSHRT